MRQHDTRFRLYRCRKYNLKDFGLIASKIDKTKEPPPEQQIIPAEVKQQLTPCSGGTRTLQPAALLRRSGQTGPHQQGEGAFLADHDRSPFLYAHSVTGTYLLPLHAGI